MLFRIQDGNYELRFESVGDGTWRKVVYGQSGKRVQLSLVTSAEVQKQMAAAIEEAIDKYTTHVQENARWIAEERQDEPSTSTTETDP